MTGRGKLISGRGVKWRRWCKGDVKCRVRGQVGKVGYTVLARLLDVLSVIPQITLNATYQAIALIPNMTKSEGKKTNTFEYADVQRTA